MTKMIVLDTNLHNEIIEILAMVLDENMLETVMLFVFKYSRWIFVILFLGVAVLFHYFEKIRAVLLGFLTSSIIVEITMIIGEVSQYDSLLLPYFVYAFQISVIAAMVVWILALWYEKPKNIMRYTYELLKEGMKKTIEGLMILSIVLIPLWLCLRFDIWKKIRSFFQFHDEID